MSKKTEHTFPGTAASPTPAVQGSPPERLLSLDAYRGLVMLAMASGGFAIGGSLARHPELLTRFDGSWFANLWRPLYRLANHQLEHVEWTGCTAWDLIQPSFMFMVGVAMPFSFARRIQAGDSALWRFGHVLLRSLTLILLGIFLRSDNSQMTNFTFEDVLTQIGLGYPFVYLLLGRKFWLQLTALVLILGGTWYAFYQYPVPPEGNLVTRYLSEVRHAPQSEWNQFSGLAAHWNKHTNFAAAGDRWFLNLFPRPEQPWEGKKFWINGGGYQTLSFVPSMATILFGLMAGELLRGLRPSGDKIRILLLAALACFVLSMAIDTTIWPVTTKLTYSLVPVVKRIWTPSWAVFAAGWTFSILAVFYWVVDVRGWRRAAFPLAVVGMNSIAVYCMAELIQGWLGRMLKIHLTTLDVTFHTRFVHAIYETEFAHVWVRLAQLFLIWLICLWMYRRRLFVKI